MVNEMKNELQMISKSSKEFRQVNVVLEQSKKKTLMVEDDDDVVDIGNPSYQETEDLL